MTWQINDQTLETTLWARCHVGLMHTPSSKVLPNHFK